MCGSPLFIKNSEQEANIVITPGTMDERALKGWKPDKEFYCKRKSVCLGSVGAEEKRQFQQVD
jgi:hypothetical protein